MTPLNFIIFVLSLNLVQFLKLINFKFFNISNFDLNRIKVSTQHKYMYMYQKCNKNEEFSPSHRLDLYSINDVHNLKKLFLLLITALKMYN